MTPVGDLRSTAALPRPPATALGSAPAVPCPAVGGPSGPRVDGAVLQGAFKPGDTIPSEEALCERFDVSRPVVREAVKTLAKVGMVRTRQGQGSMVLSEEHWNELAPELLVARCETGTADEVLAEVIELRGVLEARAAEVAAKRAAGGPGTLARPSGGYEDHGRRPRQYLFHDLQFHREVLRLGGNRLVVKLFDLLEPMLLSARQVALDHQELPEGMLRGIDEHEENLRRAGPPFAQGGSQSGRAPPLPHQAPRRCLRGLSITEREGNDGRERKTSSRRAAPATRGPGH